eukprot:CAMPEP_0198694224 /NCGR_PEP_ID=MMETSP1468-20131203/265251_1 /TAXON_ID=1461545 /ORGANISM="Mantoniella sp, Strain CCMP1436" /LENGTH=85 /DNA_ID=CAMNT_0044449261 /DNA_START=509 /DNA_END=764 /DNA_ORIENTATION=-
MTRPQGSSNGWLAAAAAGASAGAGAGADGDGALVIGWNACGVGCALSGWNAAEAAAGVGAELSGGARGDPLRKSYSPPPVPPPAL